MKNEVDDGPPYAFTRKWAAIFMAASFPVAVIVSSLKGIDKGVGAWICTGILLGAARSRWDLRNHVWYWIVVALGGALQTLFVLVVPWGEKYRSYIAYLPVACLDYGIVYGALLLFERITAKGDRAS